MLLVIEKLIHGEDGVIYMGDYTSSGYNEFLQTPNPAQIGGDQLDPLTFEQVTPQISGSKIEGALSSQNGRLTLDLNENFFTVSDGVVDRVRMGKLEDGSYGLLIKDNNGNSLLQAGDTNVMQSGSGNIVLDFDNQQLIIKDEGGTPRVVVGKF